MKNLEIGDKVKLNGNAKKYFTTRGYDKKFVFLGKKCTCGCGTFNLFGYLDDITFIDGYYAEPNEIIPYEDIPRGHPLTKIFK